MRRRRTGKRQGHRGILDKSNRAIDQEGLCELGGSFRADIILIQADREGWWEKEAERDRMGILDRFNRGVGQEGLCELRGSFRADILVAETDRKCEQKWNWDQTYSRIVLFLRWSVHCSALQFAIPTFKRKW
jgi:hypothetical protein